MVLAAMLIFVAACSGGKNADSTAPASSQASSETSASPEAQKEITLTVFSHTANYAGEQPGWFAKILKDKFNVKLNIVAPNLQGGATKFAAMMASGDLGDLIYIGSNGKDYKDAIKAGLLLDLNKDGLLEKHGQNVLKYAGEAVEANKKQYGGGTSVYGVGSGIGSGEGPSEGTVMNFGPDLRWDLYAKLGYPEIKTLNDYLPVLKKMQELEPKSESGRPTYGFSLWGDWDGNAMSAGNFLAQMHGYDMSDGFNQAQMTYFAVNEQKYQGIIDDNSYYMQAIRFYFDANQMGLLDPESLTQKFDDAANKYRDGQIFFSHFPWLGASSYNTTERVEQGKGFALVPFQDEKVLSWGFNPHGGGFSWSIGSKTKDPARVMQIIDYLFSPDGMMETGTGPKGLAWDLDKDGKPFLTEFGKKAVADGTVQVPAEYGGGMWKDGANQINGSSLHISMVNPNTGEPYDNKLWTSVLNDNPNPLTKSWREKTGVSTSKEYFVKNNLIAILKPVFTGNAPETPPTDIETKVGAIGKVIKENSWKMIYAKNEAEFDKLKQEMVTKAKGLGYDEVVNWEVDRTKRTVWDAQ